MGVNLSCLTPSGILVSALACFRFPDPAAESAAVLVTGSQAAAVIVVPDTGRLAHLLEQLLETRDAGGDDGDGDLSHKPEGNVACVPKVVALQTPIGSVVLLDDARREGEVAERLPMF